VGVMCFIYAEDPLFRTMFPGTEIAKKYGLVDFVFWLVSSVKQQPNRATVVLRQDVWQSLVRLS